MKSIIALVVILVAVSGAQIPNGRGNVYFLRRYVNDPRPVLVRFRGGPYLPRALRHRISGPRYLPTTRSPAFVASESLDSPQVVPAPTQNDAPQQAAAAIPQPAAAPLPTPQAAGLPQVSIVGSPNGYGAVYIARTPGAIHIAPLPGHFNSVTSLNVAPAVGNLSRAPPRTRT